MIFIVPLVLGLQSLQGAIFYQIDTTMPLKCTFSSLYQNRVAVDKGRVEKAIYCEDMIDVRLEEESGQAFVYCTGPTAKETVLSIVTDKGQVQDIELTFEEQSTEVVILQNPSKTSNYSPHSQEISTIINEVLCGRAPKGFCCFTSNLQQQELCGVFLLDPIATFEGLHQSLHLLRIVNNGRCENYINEVEINLPSTLWVYLVKHDLLPQEETLAIVAIRKEL